MNIRKELEMIKELETSSVIKEGKRIPPPPIDSESKERFFLYSEKLVPVSKA